MQEYKKYLETNELIAFINKQLISHIYTIVTNFRNRSAHPEILTIDHTKEVKLSVPEILNNIF